LVRHDGRRLGSFLHLLVQGRWLLETRGRWDDPGLSVEPNLVSQEWNTGEELAVGVGADAPVPGDDKRRQRSECRS